MSKVSVFIQLDEEAMVSAPSLRNKKRGRRLTKKASFTAVFTCVWAQSSFRGRGFRVVSTGKINREKIMSRLEVIIMEGVCITTTWSCTKSFRFLRPTDELLSFGSKVPRTVPEFNRGDET